MNQIIQGHQDGVGSEYVCPVCGRHFFPSSPSEWVYKDRNGDLVCSYTCTKMKVPKEKFIKDHYSVGISVKAVGSREKLYRALHKRGFATLVDFTEWAIAELYKSVEN